MSIVEEMLEVDVNMLSTSPSSEHEYAHSSDSEFEYRVHHDAFNLNIKENWEPIPENTIDNDSPLDEEALNLRLAALSVSESASELARRRKKFTRGLNHQSGPASLSLSPPDDMVGIYNGKPLIWTELHRILAQVPSFTSHKSSFYCTLRPAHILNEAPCAINKIRQQQSVIAMASVVMGGGSDDVFGTIFWKSCFLAS